MEKLCIVKVQGSKGLSSIPSCDMMPQHQRGGSATNHRLQDAGKRALSFNHSHHPRPFITQQDIHVDPNLPKIKLEVKGEPEDVKPVEEIDLTEDEDRIRIIEQYSLFERSIKLKDDVTLKDEKTEFEETPEEEVVRLRAEVRSLQQAVEEQGSLILKLNELVKKHDNILNEKYNWDERKDMTGKIFHQEKLEDERSSTTSREGASETTTSGSGLASNRGDGDSVMSDSDDQHNRYNSKKDDFPCTSHRERNEDGGSGLTRKTQTNHEISPFWRFHTKYRNLPPSPKRRQMLENQQRERRDQYRYSHLSKWGRGFTKGRGYQGSQHCPTDPRIQTKDLEIRLRKGDNPHGSYSKRRDNERHIGHGNHNDESDNVNQKQSENRRMGRHSKAPEENSVDDENDTNDEEAETFQWPNCPWKFRARQDLQGHTSHTQPHDSMFICRICGEEYIFQESLRRHLDYEHDIEQEDEDA